MRTQTELHRHLDVSFRISTAWEILREQGDLPLSESLTQFYKRVVLRSPQGSLNATLAAFELFRLLWKRPEHFERIAYEATWDVALEGTTHAEFRYSPHFTGLYVPWSEGLEALQRGIKQACAEMNPSPDIGLICIASREAGLEKNGVEATVSWFLKHRDAFVGFDLAGPEDLFPFDAFEPLLQPLRQNTGRSGSVPLTIHAGESVGPDSIWFAIETLGARRIGHGIAACEDPLLMRTLRDRKIPLEICPTSNSVTGATQRFPCAPLRTLRAHGVPMTLNTDDPALFGTTLPLEFRRAEAWWDLRPEDFAVMEATAQGARFFNLPPKLPTETV